MKQRIFFLFLILACSAAFFSCASPVSRPCPPCEPCPACPAVEPVSHPDSQISSDWLVIDVIDGDTLVVRKDEPIQRKETVRMLCINTPERDQPGYGEAREALKYIVRGGVVTLEFEKPSVEKRDVYGRLLAYVIAGGVNANIEIVRLGWSPYWTKYGKGRLSQEFGKAEQEAREKKAGMWGKER